MSTGVGIGWNGNGGYDETTHTHKTWGNLQIWLSSIHCGEPHNQPNNTNDFQSHRFIPIHPNQPALIDNGIKEKFANIVLCSASLREIGDDEVFLVKKMKGK